MEQPQRPSYLGLMILLGFFFTLFIAFAFLSLRGLKQGTDKFALDMGKDKVGVITVEGVIMDSKQIVEKLHKAESNELIKVILIRVNSPGGAVAPTQEVFDEIIRIDKKKPVYSSFGSMAASGGYYIGAATREIYAERGTLTGSIGVIMHFMDLSKLYEFAKVSPQIIKAGRYKDIGAPSRPMKNEERGLLESVAANVHSQFKKDILKRRKGKLKTSLDDLAQGQIFSGEQAVAHGLVDKLGGLWQAGREIHKKHKLEGDFKLFYIEDEKKGGLMDFIDGLKNVKSLTSSIQQHFPNSTRPMMFLWNAK